MSTTTNETGEIKAASNHANGMSVMGHYKGAAYIRLPLEISAEITSGCICDYCVAHPDIKPRWDTLCVPTSKGKDAYSHTWTVHMPDTAAFLNTVISANMKGAL